MNRVAVIMAKVQKSTRDVCIRAAKAKTNQYTFSILL